MDKLTEHFCISSKFGSYPVWEHLCGSVDPYMSEVTCLFLNSDLTPFPLSTCSSNYTWTSFIKMYFYFLFKIIMGWWNTYQIQRHTDFRMLATVELFDAKYVKYVSCKIRMWSMYLARYILASLFTWRGTSKWKFLPWFWNSPCLHQIALFIVQIKSVSHTLSTKLVFSLRVTYRRMYISHFTFTFAIHWAASLPMSLASIMPLPFLSAPITIFPTLFFSINYTKDYVSGKFKFNHDCCIFYRVSSGRKRVYPFYTPCDTSFLISFCKQENVFCKNLQSCFKEKHSVVWHRKTGLILHLKLGSLYLL